MFLVIPFIQVFNMRGLNKRRRFTSRDISTKMQTDRADGRCNNISSYVARKSETRDVLGADRVFSISV